MAMAIYFSICPVDTFWGSASCELRPRGSLAQNGLRCLPGSLCRLQSQPFKFLEGIVRQLAQVGTNRNIDRAL